MTILEKNDLGGGIIQLRLNRPDVHNAFNADLIAALREQFTALSGDDSTRVIILSSNGKNFSAGGDLKWMQAAAGYSYDENVTDATLLAEMLASIYDCRKLVIAAVQGAAMGGGVGLTSCADIAIAAPNAKFALSEVKLGLAPSTISPYVIKAIGARQARRYFQTAEMFDASTAHHMGLVHEITDDPLSRALEIAKAAVKNGPEAVIASKELVDLVDGQAITADLRHQTAEHIATRRASDEAKEGLKAFFEKRPASWSVTDE